MKIDHCNALITGASSGIGREFAQQLAGRAQSLVLVARNEERLSEARNKLTRQHPSLTVHIRKTDLANHSAVEELNAWLEHEKIHVDLLINNANVVALTFLTRSLLPQMIARKRGAILNVSSSAGFLPIPGFAVYAATKAYVTSFSEALRAELRETGVSVCTLCPGPVHTEFQEVAKRPGEQPEGGPGFVHVPVEQVVRDALAALEADRPLVIPGFAMKVGMLLVRLTPMPILRWASQVSKKRN